MSIWSLIFRSPFNTNARAVRDMGLGAWWGMSLMNLGGVLPAGRVFDDPKQTLKAQDAGLKASRGLQAGAVGAYLVGTSLVRFGASPLGSNGIPRWMTEGVESIPRSLATAAALGAGAGAKILRAQAIEAYDKGDTGRGAALRKQTHALHALIPAIVGGLLYSHVKQDIQAPPPSKKKRLLGVI